MIVTENLTKVFNHFRAVEEVSIRVERGEVLAMLGPNGAGKTTTVRMMTSILPPTSGTALIAGFDVVRQSEQVRQHVGVLTEQHGLYERMRGLEYLDFFGQIYGMSRADRQQRAQALMERFDLAHAGDKRVGEYSKGMKQKLALLRALLHNPPVLLLDEPTSAMDPQSAKLVRQAIIEMQRGERTILITTHNLTEAQLLADRIAIIRRGRVIAQGKLDELRQQFVGTPMMELRIQGDAQAVQRDLAAIVKIEAYGADWLQYRTKTPAETNTAVLQKCLDLGVPIITLSRVTQTLEDVYLQAVEEDEAQSAAAEPA